MRMIGPLPAMGRRAKEAGHDWREMHRGWQSVPMEPLAVTAHLATPYVPARAHEHVHLDALLEWAVMDSLPGPIFFPNDTACVMPIPVRLLWASGLGLPLWAATPLHVVGESLTGREYWHKRYPSDRADLSVKRAANTSAGRWKEYRTPISTVSANVLAGMCVGIESEVARLLAGVTHIGKKVNSGHGRVAVWTVEPISLEDAEAIIMSRRPVPVEAVKALNADLPDGQPARLGWTPPYWYAPWHADCIVPSNDG